MAKVSDQLDNFKRVIGEIQDANQDDFALDLLPIAKKLESIDESM
jgi:hypothetical protein